MVVYSFIVDVVNFIGVCATDGAPLSVTAAAFDLAAGFEVWVARFAGMLALGADRLDGIYLLQFPWT